MNDLAAFVLAQLDAEERMANSATSGPWSNADSMASDGVYAKAVDGYVADCDYERMGPFAVHNATHIAHHNPARVLRDVAAKRAIVELHAGAHSCRVPTSGTYPSDWPDGATYGRAGETWTGSTDEHFDAGDCPTLRLLASVWDGNDGWRDEWRVA